MRRILGAEYEQELLLPTRIGEWVGPEHPARFIREVVSQMDLGAMGLDTINREEGGEAYAPQLLLSAWLYGYYRKVRSTRALEAACRDEMGFIWLTGDRRPDHNALWRFWRQHREALKAVFSHTVKVALKLGLVGMVTQAVDGTKIIAQASGRKTLSAAKLKELLRVLDEQVQSREAEIAAANAEGSANLPASLRNAQRLREEVKAALAQAEETGQAVNPVEPEAQRMKTDGQNRLAYNAQAVVDESQQIIVASEVVNEAADHQQLTPMIEAAQKQTQGTSETYLADGGFINAEQLDRAQRQGLTIVGPLPSSWKDTTSPYHASHFTHLPERDVVICPQNQELLRKRTRRKGGVVVAVYQNRSACAQCPVRSLCTSDRHGRQIDIQPGRAALLEHHQRWPQMQAKYARRAPTIEPVFAQIKQQMGFRRWTFRGLSNVRTQWAILCATWNLKCLFRFWKANGSLAAA